MVFIGNPRRGTKGHEGRYGSLEVAQFSRCKVYADVGHIDKISRGQVIEFLSLLSEEVMRQIENGSHIFWVLPRGDTVHCNKKEASVAPGNRGVKAPKRSEAALFTQEEVLLSRHTRTAKNKKAESCQFVGRVACAAASGNRTQLSSVTGWHTNRYTNTAHLLPSSETACLLAKLRSSVVEVRKQPCSPWPSSWLRSERPTRLDVF